MEGSSKRSHFAPSRASSVDLDPSQTVLVHLVSKVVPSLDILRFGDVLVAGQTRGRTNTSHTLHTAVTTIQA